MQGTSGPGHLRREEGNAARDLDHGASDITRLIRAEEGDRVCDVLWLPESLEDGPRPEPVVHGVRLRGRLARLALDDARRDRVGGDVVATTFERGRLGEADQRRLGRRVARLAETAQRPGNGRHEDDAAPLVLNQVWPRFLGAVERTGEVDLHIPVPQLVRLVGDLSRVVEGRRVVDEDVEL